MKLYAFFVKSHKEISLDDVLTHLKNLSLEKRLVAVNGVEMRLESVVPHKGGSWSLDFTKIRPDGPGKISRTKPIEDFELEADDGFGEETAAYYSSTGFIAIQYNHNGPKASAIEEYLNRFASKILGQSIPENLENEFELIPVIKQDAQDRFGRISIVRKLEISIFNPGLPHTPNTKERSLEALTKSAIVSGVDALHVVYSAGRKKEKKLKLSDVKRVVKDLLRSPDELKVLRVTGRTSDGSAEPIDFIEERVSQDINLIRGKGRRYEREARINAARSAVEYWKGKGLLGR